MKSKKQSPVKNSRHLKWWQIKALKREGIQFRFGTSTIPGTSTIEVVSDTVPMPIALIWYRFIGANSLDIVHMNTNEGYQRLGLATYAHHKLIASYPALALITTQQGNRKSKPWLLKMGFVHDKEVGQWQLKLKPRKCAS